MIWSAMPLSSMQKAKDAQVAVKAAMSVGQRTTEVAMMIKKGLYSDPRYQPILEKIEKKSKEKNKAAFTLLYGKTVDAFPYI
jgi:hypothetical protein